jgi:ribosomal protein S18 acetylase RimI-like enzyme
MTTIINSNLDDLDMIFDFYDDAIAFQKTVYDKQWLGFDKAMIIEEIKENRQYKIMQGDEVVGIFAVTFNDEQLWKERSVEPAIYIHRIVTHSKFRGSGSVSKIVDWAKNFCQENQLEYIRLDTWADNAKLVNFYVKSGFTYLKNIDIRGVTGFPAHYLYDLALFEIKV